MAAAASTLAGAATATGQVLAAVEVVVVAVAAAAAMMGETLACDKKKRAKGLCYLLAFLRGHMFRKAPVLGRQT